MKNNRAIKKNLEAKTENKTRTFKKERRNDRITQKKELSCTQARKDRYLLIIFINKSHQKDDLHDAKAS